MHHGLALALILLAQGGPGPDDVSKPAAATLEPDPAWTKLGRDLWFDKGANRVVLRARVCLKEGYLEHFMCSKGTKEHEAIIATAAIPHEIHAGLLLTGAEPGHPVRFLPKFEPPVGATIGIELEWKQGDGRVKSDARQWIRDEKTKAPLAIDWVFGGSELYLDPATKKQVYAADEGDLITVANFGNAILDLPIASSANDADRVFFTNTEKIPPVGTEVFVALSPRPKKKVEKSAPKATPK